MDSMILIRHRHAQHMAEGLTGGWTNLPLTEVGRHQARRTGWYCTGNPIGCASSYAFFSSDLLHASQTASIIGTHIRLDPVITPYLWEINNGTAAYCTQKEAETMEHPLTYPLIDWVPYTGAESWNMFRERIVRFLEGISSEENVLMVTHSHVIVAVIHWWLELDERRASRILSMQIPAA